MKLESILQCPECRSSLKKNKESYRCKNKHNFIFFENIPDFISKEDKKVLEKEFHAQEHAVGNYKENEAYMLSWKNWKKKLIVDKKGLVLDNGCGPGKLSLVIPEGNTIVGSDVSLDMLREAKKRINFVIRSMAEKLPFKNETFDVVYTDSMLHHLKNPIEGVKEVHRVLKKDGIAVFSETHAALVNGKLRRYAYKNRAKFSEWHKNFEKEELLSIIAPYFEIYSIEHVSYLGYMYEGTNRKIPCDKYLMKAFLIFDEIISKIPLIKNQSWHIIVKGVKK
ncbi:class I SAM-dependent methyltransferase [Candidatus Woesearchaeota archaeon]|nr:class I SAM-dependent methyltransferase [Candidatus Woesearchaeota archaeon]